MAGDGGRRSAVMWRSWNSTRQNGDLYYREHKSPTANWSPVVKLTTNAARTGGHAGLTLVMGPSGEVAATWETTDQRPVVAVRWSAGAPWTSPHVLLASAPNQITGSDVHTAFDSAGDLTVAWSYQDGSGLHVKTMTGTAADGFSAPTDVSGAKADAGIQLAVAPDGRAAITFGWGGDIFAAFRPGPTVAWAPPEHVAPDKAWIFSTVGTPSSPPVFLPNGNLLTVYYAAWEYQDHSTFQGTAVAVRDAGTGQWTVTTPLDQYAWSGSIKSSDDEEPHLAMSPDGTLAVGLAHRSELLTFDSSDGVSWSKHTLQSSGVTGAVRIQSSTAGFAVAWEHKQETKGKPGDEIWVSRRVDGSWEAPRRVADTNDPTTLRGLIPPQPGPGLVLRPDQSLEVGWRRVGLYEDQLTVTTKMPSQQTPTIHLPSRKTVHKGNYWSLKIRVGRGPIPAVGTVTFSSHGQTLAKARLVDGRAVCWSSQCSWKHLGTQYIAVRYLGTQAFAPAHATKTIDVIP